VTKNGKKLVFKDRRLQYINLKPHLQDQRLGKTGQNVPKIRIVSVANSGTVASTNSVSSDAINFAALRHGDSVITLFFKVSDGDAK
jgi:hypothetical protein